MAYQGDVEIIHNWREEHSIEDLQRIVERKGYSAISVGSFDHAALKKFPYQLTADHCEPSPGYSNTLYIWNGRGGGSGALGIISSVQPADADEDEDEDEDWDEGGGACMAWGYQSEDQLACYGSVSGMTYDLDHPCWHELDANPTCCNYCGPWTSSEYESTCSALDIIRVSAGCCFSVQDSSGTEHHYDQDQNFCYNGVGCDSVRSVKVYDCSGGDEDEEPGEGSGGSLGKVEVGRVMSWYDYRARAKQEGGRLPTTAELRAAGVESATISGCRSHRARATRKRAAATAREARTRTPGPISVRASTRSSIPPGASTRASIHGSGSPTFTSCRRADRHWIIIITPVGAGAPALQTTARWLMLRVL